MVKTLSLLDVMKGANFQFKHLNGRSIKIKNRPGKFIQPDTVKALIGFGLPKRDHPGEYGNLLIKYKIEFSDQLDMTHMGQITEQFDPI